MFHSMQVVFYMPLKSNLLKLINAALGKRPGNHIWHLYFILDPPKCISTFSAKLPVLFRNKAKRESKTGCSWLVFFPHNPPSFSPNKIMYELSFHPLLSFLLDFPNSWASKWIWKLLYAPMGDLTRFSKPTFWLFQMASLCIEISHEIIYCSSLWIYKVGYVHLFNTD